MQFRMNLIAVLIAILPFLSWRVALGQHGASYVRPDAIVDLRTPAGVDLLKAQWRYCQADIVEVSHRWPGPDLKASGEPNRTHDLLPHAGAADFDDSNWEILPADSLEKRRGTGRLCFNWYRIRLTIPQRLGSLDTTGCTAVFEIVVDDYAEVWVNGRQPQVLGQSGGPMIRGWNAPNRLVVAREVKPGQPIQIAVLGANGPLSEPPANFIWVRSATLDLYRPSHFPVAIETPFERIRIDPALDEVLSPDAKLEKIADGFGFTEGPVWVPGDGGDGYLLFSDPNNNTIYRWSADDGVSVFRTKSGYTGLNVGEYGQPGSNGLAVDPQGRLTICEHGNRRITRLEKNGLLTVLADRYQGRRINSPNDLIYRSDGTLYFTDPPFGLPKFFEDPRKELPVSGVFCLRHGELKLVSTDLRGPNGLAFSPDEKYLYVDDWDEKRKVILRYEVAADGSLSHGTVFFDMTASPGAEALDGMKIDSRGNLYVSGPGGVWILSPEGKQLGLLKTPQLPANFAWGDADGRTLYMTARTGVYRLRLKVAGTGVRLNQALEVTATGK